MTALASRATLKTGRGGKHRKSDADIDGRRPRRGASSPRGSGHCCARRARRLAIAFAIASSFVRGTRCHFCQLRWRAARFECIGELAQHGYQPLDAYLVADLLASPGCLQNACVSQD